MDDNNFLNSYKKKLDDEPQPHVAEPQPQTQPQLQVAPTDLHFEDKTAFVPPRPVRMTGSNNGSKGLKVMPIFIASVVVLALVVLAIWYFSRGTTVIDLVGMPLSDAQIWAGENNIKLQVTEAYNDEFDADQIVSQEPAEGSQLAKGGFLKVTVSLGHDLTVTLDLPDLLSMTMTEVETWAADNFMNKVRITTEYNETVTSGRVIRFEINDNTVVDKVKRSTPIYVIVSKGPEPQETEPITLPDFTTMTLSQAQQFAEDKGLVLIIVEEYDDNAPNGTVMDQSIPADDVVNSGTEVTLTVSIGKKIVIPDFSGYTKEKAGAVASGLGITYTVTEKYSGRSAGKFISQSAAAGSIYKPGDIFELSYSLGNNIIISSFVGQTRASIEAWAQALNAQGAAIKISVTKTQNNAPRDTILYQSRTNTTINIDATIYITISLGKKVFVPDLVAPAGSGYDLAVTRTDASAACEAVGLIVVYVEEQKTGRLPGEVWYQSEAAGTEVYEGSTITLKYCPANATVALPVFTGMTKKAILDAGWLKKLDITFVLADYYIEGYNGTVYEQSLPAGRTVAYGTAITLNESPPAPVVTTEATTTEATTTAETTLE